VVAYVRTVKTGSGAVAVQIVWSSRRDSRRIEQGSAHDGSEVEALKAAARQRLKEGQGAFDLGVDATAVSGGPLEIVSLSFPRFLGDFRTRFDLANRRRKSRWERGSTRWSCASVGQLLGRNLWSTIKIELIYWPAKTFPTRAEAQQALFRYIDGWYNPHRIQAGLGGLSPDEYEAAWQTNQQHQLQPATLQPKGAESR
jgi:Integrase core domain